MQKQNALHEYRQRRQAHQEYGPHDDAPLLELVEQLDMYGVYGCDYHLKFFYWAVAIGPLPLS